MTDAIVLDACNPGPMTGAGNQTYLMTSAGAAVLIDAGVGHPDHLSALLLALDETKSSLQWLVATHDHADHVSGAPAIAAAYPAMRFARYRRIDEAPRGVTWDDLVDGQQIGYGDTSLTVVHTPGHSPDHLAFWHAPTGVLFTGDLLIAGGSVVIEASRGGNLIQYLNSLNRILELEPRRLLPAHGPRIDDPAAVVHAHLEHRRMREHQVVDAVAAGHRTVEAIAESIYDGLSLRLMSAAMENVRAHLEKLRVDGVAADRDGWRIL